VSHAPRRAGRLGPLGAIGVAGVLVLVGCSGSSSDELSVDEYCEQVTDLQPLDDQLGQIETLELQDTADELDQLAATAPAEVEPALRTLADYVGEVVDVLDEVRPGDTDAAADALRSVTTADESAAIEAAGREVETYTQTNCRFDLRSGGTLPPTTAPPPTVPLDGTAPPTTG
jgi:hypothetical protein